MDKKLSGRISIKSQNDEFMYHSEPAQNHYLPSSKQYLTENPENREPNESHHDTESNILVALRVRPMIPKEIQQGEFDIARVEDNLIVVLDPIELVHEAQNKPILDVLHRSKEQSFAFDKIFRDESQERIYAETCKGLIHPVLNGYNSCVFAYGTTGAGKTYTMLGNQQIPGIMLLTVKDIFETIKTHYTDKEFNIIVSYVEIYNETIRDLLVPSSGYLDLRDDPNKGTIITGATEHKAESLEQIMNLLFLGNRRRTTEATNANQTSSRSHAVFQIQVNSVPRTRNIAVETICGKLSLIDLAGSERGTVTENRGLRLREGAKINRSLLALANCINALGDKTKKGIFVPYRDSKLTRLLKDSFGGNCKTVMIANISPASSQIEETLNTLKYANRARNIKTKVVSNKKLVNLHIAEYKNIINDLRQEIDELKGKLSEANAIQVVQPPRPNYGFGPKEDITSSFTVNDSFHQNREDASVRNDPARNQEECPCSCGRDQDNIEVKRIQEELFENFQQRIQIRRALMELDDQNASNVLEMRRKKAEILDWERNELFGQRSTRGEDQFRGHRNRFFGAEKRPLSACPEHIKKNYKSIRTLKFSTDQNTSKRNQLNIQLIENIAEAKRIKDSILRRVKHQDRKQYLEMVIKNHLLELQNIEYELHLKIQEKIIADLKDIAHRQKKALIDHGIAQEGDDIDWDDSIEEENDSPLVKSNQENDINIDDFVYDDDPDKSGEGSSDSDDEIEKKISKKELKEAKPDTKRISSNRDNNIDKNERRQGFKKGLVEAELNAFVGRKSRLPQEEFSKRSANERDYPRQKENPHFLNPLSKEKIYQTAGSRNLDDISDRNRDDAKSKEETFISDQPNPRALKQTSKNQQPDSQSDGQRAANDQPKTESQTSNEVKGELDNNTNQEQ